MSDPAVEAHRQRLVETLGSAADHLRVELEGTPRFGWRDRTIAARGTAPGRTRVWLRVVGEPADHPRDVFWTGNTDATTQLPEIRKPEVLNSWETETGGYRWRAEALTFIPEPTCSLTPVATTAPHLSKQWWRYLGRWLAVLKHTGTGRQAIDDVQFARRIHTWDAGRSTLPDRWTPAHTDLHWANLTAPGCFVLDWEGWGYAPAGFDVATLYLHSLPVPDLANQVRDLVGAVLDSRDGWLSQLYVAARMLDRGDLDHPDTRRAVLAHVDELLADQPSSANR